MDAKELSIGNYVIIDDVEEQVYSNLFDYDEGSDYINDRHINLIKPIELTEKWLVNFGFEKINRLNFIKGDIVLYRKIKPKKYVFRFYCGMGKIRDCDIEFVHQLQNLYFILINEKLTKHG